MAAFVSQERFGERAAQRSGTASGHSLSGVRMWRSAFPLVRGPVPLD